MALVWCINFANFLVKKKKKKKQTGIHMEAMSVLLQLSENDTVMGFQWIYAFADSRFLKLGHVLIKAAYKIVSYDWMPA